MTSHQLDVVRLNFSYGNPEDHRGQIVTVRRVSKDIGAIFQSLLTCLAHVFKRTTPWIWSKEWGVPSLSMIVNVSHLQWQNAWTISQCRLLGVQKISLLVEKLSHFITEIKNSCKNRTSSRNRTTFWNHNCLRCSDGCKRGSRTSADWADSICAETHHHARTRRKRSLLLSQHRCSFRW